MSRPMAGRQLGRYEILTQLASGGMASVYIARAQGVAGFERLVAIKVLHPHLAYEQEFVSMFLDEARLAARIRHMNVVPTIDISDSPGDGYFLVMEYIEGNHLGSLLGEAAKNGDRLPRPFVCRVLIDALQGLSAAHRLTNEDGHPLKLVHRDVSPHNILVGTDGIARLTDFGVAKADVRMASTRAGQFKGKLSYMAPEQASSAETDQRSDLFSVGIILWECLTGRRLFKGESNAATLNRLLNDTVVEPSSLWPELEPYDEVVMRALNRHPEQRFQSADEFGEALEQAAGRGGVAKTRDVAEVVRALDAAKLQDERTRVRDAIEMLGRAEFAQSNVPMPREGSLPTNDIFFGSAEEMYPDVTETGSGVTLADDTIVNERPVASVVAKWAVVVLALLVFLYAGFLVWQLLDSSPKSPTESPTESPDLATIDEVAPSPKPTEVEVTPTPKPTTAKPERKRSPEATRTPRRKARAAAARKAKAEARSKNGKSSETESAASPEPVDIDIRNPYRN
jgi:serine/threonine-protein kinase